MSDLRTAAQQALAFTMRDFASLRDFEAAKAVLHDNLRAALAQQAEPVEPVAWAFRHSDGTYHDPSVTEHSAGMVPLYPPPPQRKPLTEEEIERIGMKHVTLREVIRAVERAHGIGEQS